MKKWWLTLMLTMSWMVGLQGLSSPPMLAKLQLQNDDVSLHIINDSDQTICYVYISLITDPEMGDDWLGNDVILPAEDYFLNLSPGDYDVFLVDCDDNTLYEKERLALDRAYELQFVRLDPCLALLEEGGKLYDDLRNAEALQRLQEARNCYREAHDSDGEAKALRRMGWIYEDEANYPEALEVYHQALVIEQETGDRLDEALILGWVAWIYDEQGRYSEALNALQQALTVKLEVGDRGGEGATLCSIGKVYENQGRYDEALERYEQALVIAREIDDQEVEETALSDIASAYQSLGHYEEALEPLQQALAITRETGDRFSEGANLNSIAGIYKDLTRYEEALEAYQQALAIAREMNYRAGEATVLNNIGWLYEQQQRYNQALSAYEQALALERDSDHRDGEADELTNIGLVYEHQGRITEALAYYNQALTIYQEIDNLAGHAVALVYIASVYDSQGRYGEAIQTLERVTAIRREIGDRDGEANTLSRVGMVYHNQGQLAQAISAYQQALAIQQELGDRVGEAAALNNIALVYGEQGRYDEAWIVLQKALMIVQEVKERIGEGTTLSNMGVVAGHQGHYDKALELHEQAMQIARETGDGEAEGAALNAIGGVLEELGRYDEALEAYQQALSVTQEVGLRAAEATVLNNMGSLYHSLGQDKQALETYQHALSIRQEMSDPAGEGITLSNIGLVYHENGNASEALVSYEQAMDAFESVRAVAGSEAGRSAFIAQYADLYDRTTNLYHQQGQNEKAFFASERGRARAFLDSVVTGHIELSDEASAKVLAHEQQAYVARWAAQDALVRARAAQPPDLELIVDLEAQLETAEKQHHDVLQTIASRRDDLASLVPGRGAARGLAEIQDLLDDETTLVVYHILSDDGSLAFVLARESFTVVALPEATPENLRTALRGLHAWLNLDDAHPQSLRDLYTWLVAPLTGHLRTPTIGIVPHQLLHYVPFAALTDGETYFGEQYALFTLPSASTLPFIQENAKQAKADGRESAIVIGNPTAGDYDLVASLSAERDSLGNLPFAEEEARTVAALCGVEPLLRQDATEGTVRARASRADILHLAAHAKFNPVAPLSSLIALAPDDDYDGWLTVSEVYDLDLHQTDLIVLSACETQLGDLSAGDELVGLTRAFFFAGTPTVLASLWSVDDAATGELMVSFYQHWQQGMAKAEALQAAQAGVRENHSSPFYWAAFVLNGDPGPVSASEPTITSSLPLTTAAASPTPVQPGTAGEGSRLCDGLGTILPLLLVGLWGVRRREKIR